MGMKGKLTASLCSIGAVLLVSCIISVMEFVKVDSFASDLVSENVENFTRLRKLSEAAFDYNQDLLTVIGIDSLMTLPDFDCDAFSAACDTLSRRLGSEASALSDSLKASFTDFHKCSLELPEILSSEFINTRGWYFIELQPRYKKVQDLIDQLNAGIYETLDHSSRNFDHDFFRSIIPGIVAVGVGILMTLLLLFFLIADYARPLDKMLEGMRLYKSLNRKYAYKFEGDDQLSELNADIAELTEENSQLRKRISDLRNSTKPGE